MQKSCCVEILLWLQLKFDVRSRSICFRRSSCCFSPENLEVETKKKLSLTNKAIFLPENICALPPVVHQQFLKCDFFILLSCLFFTHSSSPRDSQALCGGMPINEARSVPALAFCPHHSDTTSCDSNLERVQHSALGRQAF